jgi:GNAT superfamily N-acetyltransferase
MENFLPNNWQLLKFQIQQENAYLNVFYIYAGKKALKNVEDFTDNPNIIALVQFYTYDDIDEANVTSVYVLDKYQGKGYAYYLLIKMAQYLATIDVKTIELQDDSDNYRQKNNLYTLLGLKYIADSGPEMFATVSTLLRKSNFEKMATYMKK